MRATEQQIESFRSFALEQLNNGGTNLTVDELYDRWRLEHPTDDEMREDTLAVKASLRDMESGETGRSFDEFDRAFRSRHDIAGPQ